MPKPPTAQRFFSSWTTQVLRWRLPLLMLVLGLSALAGLEALRNLTFDNSVEYFTAGDVERRAVLEEYRRDFGRDDLFLVLVEGDVFSPPFLERLVALHNDLEQVEVTLLDAAPEPVSASPEPKAKTFVPAGGDWGDDDWGDDDWGEADNDAVKMSPVLERVTSLVNARSVKASASGLEVGELLSPMPTDMPALRTEVLGSPALVGTLVGAGGRHTVVAIEAIPTSPDDTTRINQALREVAAAHDAEGFSTLVTGLPEVNAHLNHILETDMQRLVIASFVLMSLILFVLFRRVSSVVASMSVVALSSLWTIGMMAAVGIPVTILTNIIPAFLACVGMGDSVHIQSVFRDLRASGVPRQEAVVRSVASTGLPIVFTTLTTMAGLLSFTLAEQQVVQEVGIAGAFGVFCALVHSVLTLPLILDLLDARAAAPPLRAPGLVDGLLDWCTGLSERRLGRRLVLGTGVVLTLVSVVGMSQLAVYHNPLSWLGDDHPATVGVHTMDHDVGGTTTVHLLIEANSDSGVADLALLEGLAKLETHALSWSHPVTGERPVTHVGSVLDVMRDTQRALHPELGRSLPRTQREASDALLLFESAGPTQLREWVTADLKRSHVTVRLHWMDASSYEPFTDFLEEGVQEFLAPHATVRTTGTVFSLLSVVGALISDLIRSFGAAFVAITVIMIALLRDWKLGLVSMVPNLLPIGILLAAMGFTGVPIDMSNLVVASVIIGIAVDDTIHYLHQYQVRNPAERGVEEAIHYTLDHAGRALVSTSLILALGFGVFIFSQLGSLQRFGVLVALACMVALLVDLILTPAMLRTLHGAPDDR